MLRSSSSSSYTATPVSQYTISIIRSSGTADNYAIQANQHQITIKHVNNKLCGQYYFVTAGTQYFCRSKIPFMMSREQHQHSQRVYDAHKWS